VARYLLVQPSSGLVLTPDAPLYLLDTDKVGGVTPDNITKHAVLHGMWIDDFNLAAAYHARPGEQTLSEGLDESAFEPWKDAEPEQEEPDFDGGPDA
jgi:hypothetical protein